MSQILNGFCNWSKTHEESHENSKEILFNPSLCTELMRASSGFPLFLSQSKLAQLILIKSCELWRTGLHGNVVDNAWESAFVVIVLLSCSPKWNMELVRRWAFCCSFLNFPYHLSLKPVLFSLSPSLSLFKASPTLFVFCLYLRWIRNQSWPKDLLIFPKVAWIQTCPNKDKQGPKFCFLVG